ncbi:MAG: LysM peptidoglycan-binding domain-containing protein [Oligoflexales bacterium]|nr:LysM peptidoglycan-binding domain-containing protein [Oligoflexales bacterium]
MSFFVTNCIGRNVSKDPELDSNQTNAPLASASEIASLNADLSDDNEKELIETMQQFNQKAVTEVIDVKEQDLVAENTEDKIVENVDSLHSNHQQPASANFEKDKVSETSKSENMSLYQLGFDHQHHPYVQKWLKYFSVDARDRFQRYIDRGYVYKDLIETVLKKHGVPKELFYLALIESGFLNNARSHANAVGVWQFIAATGKRYGLRVDSYVDERRDPVRATIAAAAYLTDLHRVYQDWYLAMGGYNAGEVRILRAVMQTSERDFFKLIEQKRLPTETQNYVPKFIAAMLIGENIEKYGFRTPNVVKFPPLKFIETSHSMSLASLARQNQLNTDVLRELNPHIRSDRVPSGGKKPYKVWLPASEALAANFVHLHRELAQDVRQAKNTPSSAQKKVYAPYYAKSSKNSQFHTVRRGENLNLIAKKYGLSLASLKSMNGLRRNNIMAGQKLRVSHSQQESLSAQNSLKQKVYRVQKGDSWNRIAQKFGVTVADLKRTNRRQKDKLLVGERIVVERF